MCFDARLRAALMSVVGFILVAPLSVVDSPDAVAPCRAMVLHLIQMGVWCASATDVQPRERKTGCAWRDDRESSDASTRQRFRAPLDKGPVNGCQLIERLTGRLGSTRRQFNTTVSGRPKAAERDQGQSFAEAVVRRRLADWPTGVRPSPPAPVFATQGEPSQVLGRLARNRYRASFRKRA